MNRRQRYSFHLGDPCYARLYGTNLVSAPCWASGTVVKVLGPRLFQIRLCNSGTLLKRHLNQLRPRCGTEEDTEPGLDMVTEPFLFEAQPTQETLVPEIPTTAQPPDGQPEPVPRRSGRRRNPPERLDL